MRVKKRLPVPEAGAVQAESKRHYKEMVAAGIAPRVARQAQALMTAFAKTMATRSNGAFKAEQILQMFRHQKGGQPAMAGQTLFQVDPSGNAVAPGEISPKIVNVVVIDPHGLPDYWQKTTDLAKWLRAQYQNVEITIADDGTIQKFTGSGLDASVKRRGQRQRQAYVELKALLENAVYSHHEEADAKHQGKVAGQNVYYAAAKIDDEYFSVRIKIDIPVSQDNKPAYKDHKVSEIQIAPSLYGSPSENIAAQDKSAIIGISLSILKGEVNPSRINSSILYQRDEQGPDQSMATDYDGVTLFQNAPKRAKFDTSPMVTVTGKEMGLIPKFKKIKDMIEFVQKWIERQTGFYADNYSNVDTGWNNIALKPKGLDNTLQHSARYEKIQSIPALPEIIKNGIYLESPSAHNTIQQGMISHVFAAKLKIGNDSPLVVGFVIKEDANGKRFYDHELTTIKDLDGVEPTNPVLSDLNTEKASRFRQGDVLNIVRKHLGVKPDVVFSQSTRGSISFLENHNPFLAVINYMKTANASTPPHEFAHFARRMLEFMAAQPGTDTQVMADWQAAGRYVEAPDGNWRAELDEAISLYGAAKDASGKYVDERVQKAYEIYEAREEKFANAFLKYLREGKAPSKELRGVFERFRNWLLSIYRAIRGEILPEINAELRGLFDRMLATDEQIAEGNANGSAVEMKDMLYAESYDQSLLSQDVVGSITAEMARKIGIRSGELTLSETALAHIEQEHGQQIRQLGFSNAQEFVHYVLSHVDAVYQGNTRRIVEFVTRYIKPQSRVLTRLEFEISGDKYEIRTAGPVRQKYYNKRTPLWERAHSAPSTEADPMKVSHRASPGQSGEQLNFTASKLNGNGGGETFYQAAMMRAQDDTVADFAKRIINDGETKKSYFEMQPGSGFFSSVSVRLPADSIRHRDKEHPGMTDEDMSRLPLVLGSLKVENANVALPKKDVPRFAGKGVLGWAVIDGQAYGVILESVRPDRAIVATYFKDSKEAMANWFKRKADTKKAVTTPAALWPAQASN